MKILRKNYFNQNIRKKKSNMNNKSCKNLKRMLNQNQIHLIRNKYHKKLKEKLKDNLNVIKK